MTVSESCLIAKLSHYVPLDNEHEELLSSIEKREQPFSTGEEIFARGDEMVNLYVVKSGWLYGYTNLPDGGRHVVRFYHAGDIVGLPSLAFNHYAINLRAANAGCLCPFGKKDLDLILTRAPRISALLLTMSSREEVILIDILRAASRMKPRARLAYLFLDIFCRLRITNKSISNRIHFPLTQSDIGDAIGLTNVTVSRTIGEMEEEQLIKRIDGDLILHDEMALRDLCDFSDRHKDMDCSWFPAS